MNKINEDEVKKSLTAKSDKSGIAYGILKKVFDRGYGAWKTGHRPGTNATQWAYARVNGFIAKGKGTWGGADKDLAQKVKSESKTFFDKFGLFESKHVPLDTPMLEAAEPELNSPKRSEGPKKYVVYVKDPKTGNVKKINFGDEKGGLSAKINDKAAAKNFASRHNCETKTDKLSAGYWSCRLPKYAKELGLKGGGSYFW